MSLAWGVGLRAYWDTMTKRMKLAFKAPLSLIPS